MYHFFLISLLLSPLPFGANSPWAWSLYAVVMALLGLVFCLQLFRGKTQEPFIFKPIRVSFYLFCIPVGWILLQASGMAPQSWAHPFWQLAAEQLQPTLKGHISLAPPESWTALMRLLSYGVVFLLSLQFNQQSDKAVLTFKMLAYAGFIYAIYGLIECLGHFDMILWFDKTSYQGYVTSTFINRNSYATYAGLTILACIPFMLDSLQDSYRHGLSSNYGRQYFFENVVLKGWLPLLMVITLISALMLSQSRGGILSTTLAIFMLLIILVVSGKIPKKRTLVWFIVLIAFFAWFSLGQQSIDNLMNRFDAITPEGEGRTMVYNLLGKANSENRWLGVGYGSFEKSFRLYRDESISGLYDKAHNTYLENIFELGLFQAWALFLAILWLALVCLRGVWVRRRNWIYPAIGVAATVLVGAHALVDFSLQIPAVAYTYALIMGVAVAQSLPTRKVS